jgi:hypothetical protein
MGEVYYPSCKLKAGFPNTAQAATDYMTAHGATIGKCCRDETTRSTSGGKNPLHILELVFGTER